METESNTPSSSASTGSECHHGNLSHNPSHPLSHPRVLPRVSPHLPAGLCLCSWTRDTGSPCPYCLAAPLIGPKLHSSLAGCQRRRSLVCQSNCRNPRGRSEAASSTWWLEECKPHTLTHTNTHMYAHKSTNWPSTFTSGSSTYQELRGTKGRSSTAASWRIETRGQCFPMTRM